VARIITTAVALLAAASLVLPPAGAIEDPPRTVTIAAVGDVLIHRAIADAAWTGDGWDFTPLFSPVEPWISSADVAFCQMEGTLSPTNTGLLYQKGLEHPAYFNAPHEVADALAAVGFDVCSTASNHSLDRGFDGVVETLDVLEAAGVAPIGTRRDPEDRSPALIDADGVTVAVLAATWGTNRGTDKPWAVELIDVERLLTDAAAARAGGAHIVVVSLHWGTEYQPMPGEWQREMAGELLASPDIDLVLGHHSHVVQPVEWIGGEPVVYGMGNHLSNIRGISEGAKLGGEDGMIVQVTFVEQPDGRFAASEVEFTATWVDLVTKRVLPVAHTLATHPGQRESALRYSWERTTERVALIDAEAAQHTPTPWPALECGGHIATIIGSPEADRLVGTDGDDVIVGRGGSDSIRGLGGDDLVCGGDGNDLLNGGDGADRLLGGEGTDLLVGGSGDDMLRGGDGDDRLAGGAGSDTGLGDAGSDTIDGGTGNDWLIGGSDADTVYGGAGDDRLFAWSVTDTLIGGDGEDGCTVSGAPVDCG
jgi:poly-gamma-glutamate synthesis protein (capsule biosynthesis protein)